MRNVLLMALALTAAGCSGCEKQPTTESAPAASAAPAAPAAAAPAPREAEDLDSAARRAAQRALENESAFARNHALAEPAQQLPPDGKRPSFQVPKRRVFAVPGSNGWTPTTPEAPPAPQQ